MYEVIATRTHAFYAAPNISVLCAILEEAIQFPNLPSFYWEWSASRCIVYLIEAGHVIPFDGPDWFLALKATPTAQNIHREIINLPLFSQAKIDFVENTGKLSEGVAEVDIWRHRNYVRVLFRVDHEMVDEVFMTESSLRHFWVALGQAMGFDPHHLADALQELPTTTHKEMDHVQSLKAHLEEMRFMDEVDIGDYADLFWDEESDVDVGFYQQHAPF